MPACPHDLSSLIIADDQLAHVLSGEALLVEDGAMGTMLQTRGLLAPGAPPDLLCLTNPDGVTAVQAAYAEAGAQLVITNTFGAGRLKLADPGTDLAALYAAASSCARAGGARYVAGDIGPTGELLEPYGDLEEGEAFALFAEQARAARDAGCDLIVVETMTDLAEAEIAVKAARAETDLPIFATMAFQENGFTAFGATPEAAAETLAAAGASAVGLNCSLAPSTMREVVRRFVAATELPVIAKPNAGLPELVGGKTVYRVDPEDFAREMSGIIDDGATIVGGCCGTDERFIAALAQVVRARSASSSLV